MARTVELSRAEFGRVCSKLEHSPALRHLTRTMKTTPASFVAAFALVLSVQAADVSVKISNVHLCCQGCVKGVKSAVGKVQGVTVNADEDSSTVSLTGPDKATVQ